MLHHLMCVKKVMDCKKCLLDPTVQIPSTREIFLIDSDAPAYINKNNDDVIVTSWIKL